MTMAVALGRAVSCQTVSPDASAQISSGDLTRMLALDGAQIIGSDDHGDFVRSHHQLIFVRRASQVAPKDLRDTLRAAQMGPGRFDILLAKIREETGE